MSASSVAIYMSKTFEMSNLCPLLYLRSSNIQNITTISRCFWCASVSWILSQISNPTSHVCRFCFFCRPGPSESSYCGLPLFSPMHSKYHNPTSHVCRFCLSRRPGLFESSNCGLLIFSPIQLNHHIEIQSVSLHVRFVLLYIWFSRLDSKYLFHHLMWL